MRVAVVGNQDNNGYRLALWMRDLGADAHLYVMQRECSLRGSLESIDLDIRDAEGRLPDWIHPYDDDRAFSLYGKGALARSIVREFDVVITTGGRGLMAVNQFPDQSVVHLSIGEDVGVSPLKAYRWGTPLKERIACFRMRQGLFRTRRVLVGVGSSVQALYRLGLQSRMMLWGYPEDVQRNRARVNQQELEKLTEQYARYDRVFVWLCRLNFLDPSIPDYKGPERFLEAFEQVVRKDNANVRAIIGAHGFDTEAFKAMVTKKGLDDHVDYVTHLPYHRVLTYFRIPNAIVFDRLMPDSSVGMSGLTREAISVGAVLIKSIDQNLVEACFGAPCPIVQADDGDSVREAMRRLMDDEYRDRVRDELNHWAKTYLDYPRNTQRLLEYLKTVQYAEELTRRYR